MDKYRLVEEKYIGAQGFIDDNIDTDISREKDHSKGLDTQSIVRITQQAKPRSCITTAMNLLVRVAEVTDLFTVRAFLIFLAL